MRIFDFDGVIGSAFEEALFTMPETPTDAAFMNAAQDRFRLNLEGESRLSRRYMLIQRCMWEMNVGIEEGPRFHDATDGRPIIVLTARSDLFAVKRMHQFLDYHGIRPTRTFHVGSVPKHHTVTMMLKAMPKEQFTFYDDNQGHVDGVNNLKNDRVSAFFVDNDMEAAYERASTFYTDQLLEYVK